MIFAHFECVKFGLFETIFQSLPKIDHLPREGFFFRFFSKSPKRRPLGFSATENIDPGPYFGGFGVSGGWDSTWDHQLQGNHQFSSEEYNSPTGVKDTGKILANVRVMFCWALERKQGGWQPRLPQEFICGCCLTVCKGLMSAPVSAVLLNPPKFFSPQNYAQNHGCDFSICATYCSGLQVR